MRAFRGRPARLFTAAVLLGLPFLACLGQDVRNGPEHGGFPVDCDLPAPIRVTNTVGTDGLGLCVWASAEMMARYTHCEPLMGVFDAMKREPGGGWPARVDQVMRSRAPGVAYQQYQGPNLAFIRRYIDSGRPVCVTYGYGDFYRGQTIAHMVLCVAMNDQFTAVIDNNDTGYVTWMTTGEFKRRFGWPRGQGWAWAVETPPPPPVPHNRQGGLR